MIGTDIIVSEHALEDSDQRNFPISRHRSARVHKKLVKRHGGEFRKVGCAYKIGGKIVMHPNIYAEFQKAMDRQIAEAVSIPQHLLKGNSNVI